MSKKSAENWYHCTKCGFRHNKETQLGAFHLKYKSNIIPPIFLKPVED